MSSQVQLVLLVISTLILFIGFVLSKIYSIKNINYYNNTIISIFVTNIILFTSYYDNGSYLFILIEKAIPLTSIVIFRNLYIDFFKRLKKETKTSIVGTFIRVMPYVLTFILLVDLVRIFVNEVNHDYIGAFNQYVVYLMLAYQLIVVGLLLYSSYGLYRNSVDRFKQIYLSNMIINLVYIIMLAIVSFTGNLEKEVLMSGITYVIFLFALIVHSPLDSYLPNRQTSLEYEKNEVERRRVKAEDRRTLDSLTGLYTREYFIRELSVMDVNDDSLTIVIINITGLKLINESFGYDIGDEILQDVAMVLSEVFHDSMIARMSGSRFSVLQFGISEDALNKRLKSIIKSYASKDNYSINLHFGYYMRNKSDLSPYDVFKRAEEVLYYNKLLSEQRHQDEHADKLYGNFNKILPSLSTHLKRCSELAEGFSEYLKLPKDQVRDIKNAALLHDIALTFVPTLTDYKVKFEDDFGKRLYRNHVSKGFEIALESGLNSRTAKTILHHHENYDGSGYPDQLSGDSIPYEAQIVAIVDFVDMVIHYHNQSKELEKLLELKIGVEFSQELVYNMVAYMNEKKLVAIISKET